MQWGWMMDDYVPFEFSCCWDDDPTQAQEEGSNKTRNSRLSFPSRQIEPHPCIGTSTELPPPSVPAVIWAPCPTTILDRLLFIHSCVSLLFHFLPVCKTTNTTTTSHKTQNKTTQLKFNTSNKVLGHKLIKTFSRPLYNELSNFPRYHIQGGHINTKLSLTWLIHPSERSEWQGTSFSDMYHFPPNHAHHLIMNLMVRHTWGALGGQGQKRLHSYRFLLFDKRLRGCGHKL